MAKIFLAAFTGLVMAGGMPDGPSDLLAPADPARETHWSPPVSPTTGLYPFMPVDPKDWRQMNRAVAPAPEKSPNGEMPDMPGMGGAK